MAGPRSRDLRWDVRSFTRDEDAAERAMDAADARERIEDRVEMASRNDIATCSDAPPEFNPKLVQVKEAFAGATTGEVES